jgi:hypothetical protein
MDNPENRQHWVHMIQDEDRQKQQHITQKENYKDEQHGRYQKSEVNTGSREG